MARFPQGDQRFRAVRLQSDDVCTCPSCALIHQDFNEEVIARAIEWVKANRLDAASDMARNVGAQAKAEQQDRNLSHPQIAFEESDVVLTGGGATVMDGELSEGF